MKAQVIRDLMVKNLLLHPAGNRIKSTTEAYHLFKQKKQLKNKDLVSYAYAIAYLTPKKGLLQRYPYYDERNKVENEQHDDYMSVCTSTGIDKRFKIHARDFFIYGLKHFFHYQNAKCSSFKEWLSCFRQPYQIGIMILCSGWLLPILTLPLSILCYLHLWGAILVESFKKPENTSGKLLMWQLYHAYMPYRFIISIPLWIFKKQMIKQYGSFTGMFPIYYHAESGMSELAEYATTGRGRL